MQVHFRQAAVGNRSIGPEPDGLFEACARFRVAAFGQQDVTQVHRMQTLQRRALAESEAGAK